MPTTGFGIHKVGKLRQAVNGDQHLEQLTGWIQMPTWAAAKGSQWLEKLLSRLSSEGTKLALPVVSRNYELFNPLGPARKSRNEKILSFFLSLSQWTKQNSRVQQLYTYKYACACMCLYTHICIYIFLGKLNIVLRHLELCTAEYPTILYYEIEYNFPFLNNTNTNME